MATNSVILPPSELLGRVRLTYDIFARIIQNPQTYDSLSSEKRKELATGINKAYGQAEAFLVEYLSVVNAESKGRAVITQVHGDVTVGQSDEMFAKTIECKSVTVATKSGVNSQLEKAFRQLGGETGHTPRDGDVRVAEVRINSRDNPWPAAGGAYTQYRETVSIQTLCGYAVAEVTAQLKKAQPLVQWLMGQTYQQGQQLAKLGQIGTYTNAQQQAVTNPNSSRLVAVTPPTPWSQGSVSKVRCVTVKIRFQPPYPISLTNLRDWIELGEMTLQAYRNPQTGLLTVEVTKYKELHLDAVTDVSTVNVMRR